MKLFSRNKRTPYIPEGVQVFHDGTQSKPPKKRRLLLVVAVALTGAIVIGAGLFLGQLWSTRDDNSNPDERAASEQRVKQDPQDTTGLEQPEAAVPTVEGGVNESSPSN